MNSYYCYEAKCRYLSFDARYSADGTRLPLVSSVLGHPEVLRLYNARITSHRHCVAAKLAIEMPRHPSRVAFFRRSRAARSPV